ncbi:hypothetical protein [Nodosilinea sp. E11]|uniref:hypothetical protein n=1 Tax=Nodosilinea sp. E11 TaxID=3037479 RepID=UPI002934D746|nr:hypothetical protein [Nodosilinea sp. E11]WOD40212.1 hypothetical protein RRF56_05330 [Nodosilinea sp. E11]
MNCRRLVYLTLGLVLALALTWFKVPATIVPPIAPSDPVTVYVVESGLHARLVVPLGDRWVQYGFGDWDYYARHRQDLYHAVRALIWPTPGALGWGNIESLDHFRAIAEPRGFRFLTFAASAAHTSQLIADLGNRFERQTAAGHVFNPKTNLNLAQDERIYAIWHNSNHELAQWLEALDCRVEHLWLWREFHLASAH